MAENNCPSCGEHLPAAQINVAKGIAFCLACETISKLDDVMRVSGTREALEQMPPGCEVTDAGREVRIRVSLRSVTAALGYLAISLFWNGIVSVFVILAIGSLITHLFGPLPDWVPVPTSSTDGPEPGKPKEVMSLGMTIFLMIFLIPFVTIGACMIGALLLSLFGRIDVRLGEESASVRTGFGPFGWTRRFDPREVRGVSIGETSWKENDQAKPVIRIDVGDSITFGSTMSESRRDWLRAALHVLLVTPDSEQREMIMRQAALKS